MKLWYENHDMRGLSFSIPDNKSAGLSTVDVSSLFFHGFVKAENENDLKEFDHHGILSSDTR